jgi:hypothetical protein
VARHDKTTQGRIWTKLRFRYVKLVVILVATQACPATVCVSCQRDVRYELRFRYVKLVVVLVATQACLATVCISCQRDARYSNIRNRCPEHQNFVLLQYLAESASPGKHFLIVTIAYVGQPENVTMRSYWLACIFRRVQRRSLFCKILYPTPSIRPLHTNLTRINTFLRTPDS